MGVFDKLKNFFYDEEEVEVNKPKEEQKKEEDKEEKQEKVEEPKKKRSTSDVENVISERELFKSEPTFKFPVIFEDDDFVEQKKKKSSMNVLDFENNKVREDRNLVMTKKSFKPSPIISPIYGVLDKDYKKEDQVSKSEGLLNLYESKKEIDFDTVIEKAYGRYTPNESPEPEPEDKTMFFNLKEEKEKNVDFFEDMRGDSQFKEVKEDEPKIDIDVDIEVENNNYVMSPDDEKLKSIDDLLDNTSEQDFYTLIDQMYKNEEEEDEE